jgi:hypothetical protein
MKSFMNKHKLLPKKVMTIQDADNVRLPPALHLFQQSLCTRGIFSHMCRMHCFICESSGKTQFRAFLKWFEEHSSKVMYVSSALRDRTAACASLTGQGQVCCSELRHVCRMCCIMGISTGSDAISHGFGFGQQQCERWHVRAMGSFAVQTCREVEVGDEGEGEGKTQLLGSASGRKALVVCPLDNTIWAISRGVRCHLLLRR